MCTYQKKIFNPYTHSSMYVPCGHCPACQMEKANSRLRRIKNSIQPGKVSLFVTLTYAPKFLPYIKPSEVKPNIATLNIYRDYDVRKVRKTKDYEIGYEYTKREKPLKTIDCFSEKLYYDGSRLPRARGSRHKVGVLYFKDLQDFCKRLERNLFRTYGISGSSYKMFKVSELGETYFRPHFHLLIHLPSAFLSEFWSAIRSSWPYDCQGLDRQIEVAKNASSYVSRYVNRGSDFPRFFENKSFRPKTSFSKGFGLANKAISLPSILSATDRGVGTFHAIVSQNGIQRPIDMFFPRYALDRYFIKFKGYSRLAFSQILQLVRCPRRIYTIGQSLGYTIDEESGRDDFRRFLSLFRIRFDRFCRESQITGRQSDLEYWFAWYYYKVWKVRSSCVYRHLFDDVLSKADSLECYDNLDDVRMNDISSDLLVTAKQYSTVSDPNLFTRTQVRSSRLEKDFLSHIKRKKVTNAAYRADGMKI